MFLREHPYVAILCLSAIISSCVALTAWTRRELAPATRPFTWLMVAIASYAAIAAANAAAFSLRPSIFLATLEYIAANSVIALYFTFTLYFSGHQAWLGRRRSLIWTLPIFNMLLVITNHWHHLVWVEWQVPAAPHEMITARHGAGYLWVIACFYIYVLTGSLLVARAALNASKLYRKQALTIIASVFPPVIAGSLYAFELVPLGFNILPMSFLLTGLIYFASLFRFRLFDLLPIARDVLIECMGEGVIVLDNQGRVIDLNPAAQRYVESSLKNSAECSTESAAKNSLKNFAEKVSPYIGQPIHQVLSQWPEILSYCQTHSNIATAVVNRPHIPCYLEVQVTRLCDQHQQNTGRLLVLRDITEQTQNQIKVQQTNRELKKQLQEIQALRDQLREQATRDRLTGLFNRHYFEEAMPAELAKAKRYQSPLAVMMLDIDYFKNVNDSYGHLAGDHALRVFSKTIQAHIRTSDIACRYGGEEFVIAFPGMSLKEAYVKAIGIRQAFKTIPIEFAEFRFHATVSIGVGAFCNDGESQDQLLRKIDQALYLAKANGRDRVETVPETEPEQPRIASFAQA
jgi:diguanylate cyclase (GGDEF)-like protein